MILVRNIPIERALPIPLLPCWGEYEGVEASLRLAWEGKVLRLRYLVEQPQLRRMVDQQGGPVWEDSCVEAFLQREGENTYVNVECSASTKVLVGKGEGRQNRKMFDPSFLQSLPVSVEILENNTQTSRWKLDLELDLIKLGLVKEDEDLSFVSLRGNFYCCGDKLKTPIYLCAAEIGTLKPDFHQMQYFTPIQFVQ